MSSTWTVECADAIEWLKSQADDSIDLIFTSPPYLAARTYGIGADVACEEAWTAWMVKVVRECCRVCKGLVAVNCEGQTRDYQYLPAPFLLAADLHRAGFNLRRPAYFHRIGIPGSGGPDWLRGDLEPIVCVTRPGKLPWSDNTACGHPPKWAPGGEFSHRVSDGTRTNQWGKTGAKTGTTVDGDREKPGIGKPRPSHRTVTKRKVMTIEREGMHSQESAFYMPPTLANPGNVIQQKYTADEVAKLLDQASNVVHCNVGGGQMGSPHAHHNEAPFPLELAKFFVLSFCPPGGVVADPFSGSGTVAHAAFENGRNFVGCDIRQSQVELIHRRMRSVVPSMF